MFRMLLFFTKLTLLTFVAVWLVSHQGAIHLEWGEYVIRANTSFVFVLLTLAFLVFAGIYHLWRQFIALPKVMQDYAHEKSRNKGYQAITKGFLALASGDAKSSAHYAREAEKRLPDVTLSLLLRAQSANLNGDSVTTREIFLRLLEHKDGVFFGIRGLLSQAIKNGNTAEALSLVRKAYTLQPKRSWVIFLLLELEIFKRNWKQAHALLPKAYKQGVLDKSTFIQWRSALYLAQGEEALKDHNRKQQRVFVEKAYKADPTFAPSVITYTRLLDHFAKKKAALSVLKKAWKNQPHPIILQEYMRFIGGKGGVTEIESFTKSHPHDCERLIQLGKVALDNKLWGLARSYLTGAIERGADVRAYQLMIRLEQLTDNNEQAILTWEEKAVAAPPRPCWICSSTGYQALEWQAFTPGCGAFNTFVWGNSEIVRLGQQGGSLSHHAPPGFLIEELPV